MTRAPQRDTWMCLRQLPSVTPPLSLVTGGCVYMLGAVEIITLLGEQLPHYKLRADSVFGYEHHDWIQTPMVPSDVSRHLTPNQIQETLQYFLLCSDRVSQVTKTYHDIDAVTSLLEEKERDLELAARIGQSLLKQNCSLSKQNELLEEQLELAREEIAQLRHEVTMRDNLLHLYTNTVEESEPSSTSPTPVLDFESGGPVPIWPQTLTSCGTLGKSPKPVCLSFLICKMSWRRKWQTSSSAEGNGKLI
uniref:HAP1 N-terminal domain-containing protein n=1 Tax=Sarcophilus harrisii TaxID=9305 RepID=A0A7N4NRF3_SARHA